MEKLVDDHWQTEIQQKSLNLKPGYGIRDAAFPGSRRSCVRRFPAQIYWDSRAADTNDIRPVLVFAPDMPRRQHVKACCISAVRPLRARRRESGDEALR